MTKMELEEKVKGIAETERFLEETKLAETPEKMVEVLGNYGINITIEELENDIMPNLSTYGEGEISEEDLENVAGGEHIHDGGWVHHILWNFFSWASKGAVKKCKG